MFTWEYKDGHIGIFKKIVIESSTRIETTPEKIWNFFSKIEDNYKRWHPEDHHFWHWTKGKPLEVGSKIDSEETVGGHKGGIKATVIESIKNKKIALKPAWPLSFMCPKLEWIMETKDNNTYFVAQTHYKFGKLFLTFKKIQLIRYYISQKNIWMKKERI